MILKNASYQQFADRIIKQKRKIIVYGAGMIGQIVAPSFLSEYKLEDYLLYYVDMDSRKHGMRIDVASKSAVVNPVEHMTADQNDYVILLTNSYFHSSLKFLEEYDALKDREVYILPVMQSTCEGVDGGAPVKTSKEAIIPKKIHYCWFSGNPMPAKLESCIDSWKKYCPDYEIIRWDESNYDINQHTYTRQAYQNKKWGFIPDIARLQILYEHGGIYMDTDVELIRSLDDMLYQEAFCGVERWGDVYFGGCSGAVKGHETIRQILEYRVNDPFVNEDGSLNLTTCGYYETKPLIEKGMKVNNTIQIIEGLTVYSSDFFCPYNYMSGEISITENTFSIHHFNGGWLDEEAVYNRKITRENYRRVLERMS